MPLRDYVAGLAFFIPTMAGAALAAWIVVRRQYAYLRGAELAVAYGLLTTLSVFAAHAVPLGFGVLSRGTVLATALLLAVGAWFMPRGAREEQESPPDDTAPSRPSSIAIAALSIAAVTVYELARLRDVAVAPLTNIDVLNFHLPGVARWIQSGSLWQIDQLFPFFVTGNYPNTGDVLTLAVTLPWRDAAFARFVEVPFIALTAVAIYALSRRLGAPRATAAMVATAVPVMPAISDYSLEGLPDVIMLFALAGGVVFLLRHAGTQRASDLVLAGLALGIAFGTKWYGVTSVAAVLVAWAAASLWARRDPLLVVRRGGALVGLVLAVGGIWLLRNLIESGNPIFPQPVSAFGVTLFGGPHHTILDRVGYTVAGYLGDPSVLRHYIVPGLWRKVGLTGALFAVGLAAGMVVAIRCARRGQAQSSYWPEVLGVASVAVLIAMLYAITPGSAFGTAGQPIQAFTTVRWLAPAPMLAAAVTAALIGRAGRMRPVLELAVLIAVIDGIGRSAPVPHGSVALALLATVVAAFAWLGYRRGRGQLRRMGRRPLAMAAGVAATLAVLAIAARVDQTRFESHDYSGFDPTLAWIDRQAPAGDRIGLAGIWSVDGISPVFPAFGPRMRNDVAYVGPWVEDLLREYRNRGAFEAAVREGDYDLLLIGRGQPPQPRVREERWATATGYRRVAASARLALYRKAA